MFKVQSSIGAALSAALTQTLGHMRAAADARAALPGLAWFPRYS
jgi:hypothetical protein